MTSRCLMYCHLYCDCDVRRQWTDCERPTSVIGRVVPLTERDIDCPPVICVRAHARYPPAQLDRGASRIPRLQLLSGERVCSYSTRIPDRARALAPLAGCRLEHATWPLGAALHALVHLHPYARATSRSKRTLIFFLVLRYAFGAL
jgi:hypothetical protein